MGDAAMMQLRTGVVLVFTAVALQVKGGPQTAKAGYSIFIYDLTLETSAPCQDDAYEDNDVPSEAVPIGAGLHEGLLGCYMDQDYFAIEVTTGQTLTVTMNGVSPSGEGRGLHLWGPDGTSENSYGATNPRTVSATATEDITYNVNAYWRDEAIEYTLEVSLTD